MSHRDAHLGATDVTEAAAGVFGPGIAADRTGRALERVPASAEARRGRHRVAAGH